MTSRGHRRGESGAVAIMVALLSSLLIGVAAMAVDLSNAFVQQRTMQQRTDFASLAAGADLPGTAQGSTCTSGTYSWVAPKVTDQAVVDAAAYLSRYLTQTVSPAQLVDCSFANGEAAYGEWSAPDASGFRSFTPDPNQLSVISQPDRVGFSLAGVFGSSGVDVGGQATVEVFSPSLDTLPMYAATGCDFGEQTIAQPSNGQAASSVNLADGSDSNAATLSSVVTSPATSPASTPYPVAASTTLTINGSGFTGATQVGFFESGATSAGPAPTVLTASGFTVNGAGTQITIPALPVSLAQDTWYVRVYLGTQWSSVAAGHGAHALVNALPLTVGAPTLTCSQGSSAGNFGTLLLPNSQGPNGQTDNIAYNVAAGLEHKLGLYPNPASDWTCAAGDPGAVIWPSEGTNCVDTKTGNVVADAAYEGLVTGVGGKPGLLTNVAAGTGCPNNGQANQQPVTTVLNGYQINDDTLSCFFTNAGVTVGDVDTPAYSLSGPVISDAIYSSPRFVYVPVLGRVPDQGGSNKYEIVARRPGFITDQANSATRSTPVSATNGLTMTSNNQSLLSLQVVLLNPSSLPPPPDDGGQVQAYDGSGPKQLRLVN